MTSTRPVSSTPGTVKTSTAPGSAPPASEAAGPTRPVLEHRARAQLGILGVLGLCAAVCLWLVWRTGPGKVRAIDLAEATARGWPTVAVPADSQYILRQPLGQLLYRLAWDVKPLVVRLDTKLRGELNKAQDRQRMINPPQH